MMPVKWVYSWKKIQVETVSTLPSAGGWNEPDGYWAVFRQPWPWVRWPTPAMNAAMANERNEVLMIAWDWSG
jgi:hypothetical protein